MRERERQGTVGGGEGGNKNGMRRGGEVGRRGRRRFYRISFKSATLDREVGMQHRGGIRGI